MDIPIKNIMSTRLKTLHPKEKLSAAKEIFKAYDIHHIPVEVMGEVRGIISLGDLLFLEGVVTNTFDEFIQTKRMELSTVDEIMTTNPICVAAEMMLSEVLDIMTKHRINALPVLDESELVGIITTYDILKYLKNYLK